ncbi:hypothetical protein ElyMa_006238000 [Elysia marginata]|uniref:Uncharacterized protein n=1 Tax=Elysia marginata TaxID=1093978 RepID=A0AAV4HA09_9GAST|nr:hypothetical protein ElyMa_006238000 [Elysia marginata]
MNKHTLNYHTRLHDWYRQHSIQLQRQEPQQQQQQQIADPAGTGEVLACEGGNLTQDKLHTIHDWCADVNRNLFRVKKREAPPLFRRCRVTSASIVATVASRSSSAAAWGRQKVKSGITGDTSQQFLSTDPRRVRSAEVFTVTGHWAKQPKVKVTGGELLAKRPGTAPRNIYATPIAQHKKQTSTEDLDLCVTNSRDTADMQDARALPRVNHDSLHLRSNALVLKQNGPRLAERMPSSPRDSAIMTPDPGKHVTRLIHSATRQQVCTSCKFTGALGTGRARAKSAHPGARLRFMDEAGEVTKVLDNTAANTHEDSNQQRAVEIAQNAKNDESSRQRPGTCKPRSQAALKTQDGKEAEDVNDQVKLSAIHRAKQDSPQEPPDTLLQVKPGFCNTCSGIYSGSTDALAATACGDCIHGIKLDSTQQLQHNLQIQRRQRFGPGPMMSAEENLNTELRKTAMEVSRVEARLSENGIHYSAERAAIREEHRRSGFGRPSTSSAAQLRARLASQMALDEDTDGEERDTRDRSEYSDDEPHEPETENSGDTDTKDGEATGLFGTDEGERVKKEEMHVTILTGRDYDGGDQSQLANGHSNEHDLDIGHNTQGVDHLPTDSAQKDTNSVGDIQSNNACTNNAENTDGDKKESPELSRPSLAREGRRKSISFNYKPVIAAPSVSNGLLNVLSIDDCKFHMRYSPHKVLEEHEITENLMLPLALLQFNNDNDNNDNNNNTPKHLQQQNETNSRVAMRISRGSSPDNDHACNGHDLKGVNTNNNVEEDLSPNTSIRSSTARRATQANVRRFKAMNDPDDINFLRHQRPKSACLAQAFHTLIHDRTVMQRLDNINNNIGNSRNSTTNDPTTRPNNTLQKSAVKHLNKSPRPPLNVGGKRTASAHVGKSLHKGAKKWEFQDEIDSPPKKEGGPRYRLINAALRRHMGDLLQEQCKKLQVRYQRQRNVGALGVGKKKRCDGGTSPSISPTPSLSLSLDSLPQTKKGILKTPTSPGGSSSPDRDLDAEHHEVLEVARGECDPITNVEQ